MKKQIIVGVSLLCLTISITATGQSDKKQKNMKTTIHKADSRGHANHGWLDAHHTFSFANYFNRDRIQFGALRVLNDDVVKGGKGFGKHPHDNMEIVTIPLRGALEHTDNTGGHGIIKAGEIQIMSAGKGVVHSEVNASATEEVNLLQIWVFPKDENIQPRYDQKVFAPEGRLNTWQTVVSPEKNATSLWINQDAWFTRGKFSKGTTKVYTLNKPTNGVYAFVIEGEITINGQVLSRRDGMGLWDVTEIAVSANEESEILLIEVPME